MKRLKPAEVDVALRLIALADTPQNLEAMQYIVFQFDFADYEQFIIEAPPGSIRFNNLIRVANFYDSLGVLVEGGAIDPEAVFELFPVPWAKVEPIIQGMRRELEWPDLFDHFEALGARYQRWWEEKRKRLKIEPQPAPPTARPRPAPTMRPPAPARPATPARPMPQAAQRPPVTRPVAPIRPGIRPGQPAAPLAGSPVAKPAPAPAKPAQPQRPAARPAPRKPVAAKGKSARPAAKGKPKAGKKRR
ncbi:MAG: hypothetical protein QN158_12435 [Armatimonadota bacterium]|nr:hypothetical protein [Armatimonadota bacterium]MDR7449459.1 hypothetical protein [Armatimonadota bacterium]MDR7460010.1 hypothetical protein [Armatimonadota bacterium]MDR7480657.1 hypothetical protein [Armatimonadota bacterium]MDR7489177.1 hypothetical protein [Armatimonadota bacterium]